MKEVREDILNDSDIVNFMGLIKFIFCYYCNCCLYWRHGNKKILYC